MEARTVLVRGPRRPPPLREGSGRRARLPSRVARRFAGGSGRAAGGGPAAGPASSSAAWRASRTTCATCGRAPGASSWARTCATASASSAAMPACRSASCSFWPSPSASRPPSGASPTSRCSAPCRSRKPAGSSGSGEATRVSACRGCRCPIRTSATGGERSRTLDDLAAWRHEMRIRSDGERRERMLIGAASPNLHRLLGAAAHSRRPAPVGDRRRPDPRVLERTIRRRPERHRLQPPNSTIAPSPSSGSSASASRFRPSRPASAPRHGSRSTTAWVPTPATTATGGTCGRWGGWPPGPASTRL